MYFPYLRGRQYELIALRELLENNKLSNNVIPIIETSEIIPNSGQYFRSICNEEATVCPHHESSSRVL